MRVSRRLRCSPRRLPRPQPRSSQPRPPRRQARLATRPSRKTVLLPALDVPALAVPPTERLSPPPVPPAQPATGATIIAPPPRPGHASTPPTPAPRSASQPTTELPGLPPGGYTGGVPNQPPPAKPRSLLWVVLGHRVGAGRGADRRRGRRRVVLLARQWNSARVDAGCLWRRLRRAAGLRGCRTIVALDRRAAPDGSTTPDRSGVVGRRDPARR